MAEKLPNSPSTLQRVDTRLSQLLHSVDPFRPKQKGWDSFVNGLLATALFRCYHIITFFTAWSTCVTLINQQKIYALNFQPTLLTVIGTVIGFVVSYRTTSSFERYNEGRRLWSQIILNSRTFGRTVWFHVPDVAVPTSDDGGKSDIPKARTLIEKKTAINLIEAFGVAVKHYLRGEVGTYYEDLWPLVKFLPAYSLPPGLPSLLPEIEEERNAVPVGFTTAMEHISASSQNLPLPNTTSENTHKRPPSITISSPHGDRDRKTSIRSPGAPRSSHGPANVNFQADEPPLLPARMPPNFHYFDVFPLSLLVHWLTKRGKEVKGRKAARLRAKMGRGKRGSIVSQNVPLEITFYLSSYIAALQRRKVTDVPTINLLTGSLNGLVDSLTGLERILTTPIPFSYRIHLWVVTTIYCLALPLQIWKTMQWLTIPATSILSFIFFGFLVAGEEIENPFGYDKNDLNMDHFTHSIIRPELMALTSLPTPEPADWAFSPYNDVIFDPHNLPGDHVSKNTSKVFERVPPDEWIVRGSGAIKEALGRGLERTKLVY